MATLTWRNVDAPDFRGVQDGYKNAAQMLNNAATGWSNHLASQDKRAADAMALEADAQQLAAREAALSQSNYLNERTRTGNIAMDLASPAIQQASQLVMRDDQKGLQDLLATNPDLARLRPEQYLDLVTGFGKSTQDTLGDVSKRLSINKDAFDFDKTKTNAADENALTVLSNTLTTVASPADAVAFFNSKKDLVSPRVQAALASKIDSAFGTSIGKVSNLEIPYSEDSLPSTPGIRGTPATTTSVGTYDKIPYEETRKYVTKIMGKVGDVGGSIDDKVAAVMPHLVSAESGGKQGAVSVDGARGVGQLMPATARQWEARLGMKPGETDKNAASNLKASTAHFRERLVKYNGDVPQALAAYNAGDVPVAEWVKKGDVFTIADSTQSSAPSKASRRSVEQALAAAIGEQNGVALVAALPTLQNKRDDLGTVFAANSGKGGLFYGMKEARGQNMLEKVAEHVNGNYNVAAEILKYSTSSRDSTGFFKTPFNAVFGNNDEGFNFNDDKIKQTISALNEGGVDRAVANAGNLAEFSEDLKKATEKADAAKAKLQEVRQKAELQPEFLKYVPAAENAYNEKIEKLNKLHNQQRASLPLNPTRPGQKSASALLSALNQSFGADSAATDLAKSAKKAQSVDTAEQERLARIRSTRELGSNTD